MNSELVNITIAEECKVEDRWRIKICCIDESWNVDLEDPMPTEAKERLRWSVEEYAFKHPFETFKCQTSINELHSSGIALSEALELRSRLDDVVLGKDVLLDIVECNYHSDFQQLHWEVLEDLSYWRDTGAEEMGPASVTVRRVFRSKPRKDELPPMVFRMLYVVARQWKDETKYIDHRLITRSLVKTLDTASPDSVQVAFEVVRPGTWTALTEHLLRTQRHDGESAYNLVHIDMHGAVATRNGQDEYDFEFLSSDHEGAAARIPAIHLAKLLKQYKIRAVVLNTCESANARAKVSANLAKLFLRHGIRTVVAMSYKLTTTGAEVFFNAFYHSLFANGLHYAEAAATGRQALRSQNQRRARYGLMASVHDWIVPVCYIDLNQTASTILWTRAGHLFFYHPFTQNLPMTLSPDGAEGHIGTSQQAVYPTAFAEAAQVDPAPPIIGRDLEVLRLEYKFTLASKIALVLSGPPGAGKTSLVMTLVYWWIRTRFASRVQYISCTSIEFDAVLDEWVTFSSDPSHTPFEGLPWIYIIDHLDEDVVDSARQEPSRVQVRLTEALSRLHCPHAKFLFVTRQMEELFMTSSPMMLLMEQSYEFGVFRLHGLSHIEAAQLGADVLARQHGNEEGVASEQVPYLRRLYDRVGNLPEGIKWILHHCHPDDSGMSVQEVLRQLDCSALTLHIWPSVRIALEALLGRTASQGLNIAFFSLFAGSCPSLGHWEEYLYFLALHEHRVLFPDFQVNSDDLRQTRSILEETAYFSGNADIFDSESHLRALLIVKSWMPTLVTDARRLERLGLVQIADENSAWLSWMHPGLSITLRRFFRLPQFADTGSAADRAFAYAMVMKHFDLQDVNRGINTEVTSRIEVNGTRNVRLGQRKQLIRRGLQNYIRAAQLGRPILCYTSENTGVIPFEGFAAYLIDVMEAINISKYIIEAKVLMQVAKSTLDDFFTAVAAGASLDIRSIETSMALLISTGKMNVGGDESHIGELWGLIRRAALVCDVPGLSIGSQMTLWALQSSPRSLFQNQQPGPSPNQALAPYVRLQAAKNEFLRACRLPGQIEMSDDWLYESFLEYRARWLEYEQSDPPRQQQDVAVLLEERILRTDASVASQADLRRLLAAYARFITHENKNEQVERCFTIEQLRLERRLAEAKDEAYEGLEQAIHSGDLQGEYDFRRYILEVHDDMPPLEAQSYITHLRRLEGELSHHQTVPRNFSVCSCWYPAVQAELADARSDPVGMLQQSLEAISHAIFSCPEWSHAQKTLCGTQNRITSISSTTVLFLRLCLKYKFTNCPDPISLYDVSNSIFKSYVQQRACSTGHIWTYDVEAMHDISQMLDLPLEMVLERLFRVYATAINDQLSPEIQPGVTLETRLSDIRVRLDTEERLLFMPRVLPEVSDRGQETLDDLAGRFTEENLQRWNQSKVRAFSNSLESESSEPRPSLGVCAVLRDVDAFLWNDTFSSSEGLGLRDAEGVHYVLEPQVLRQVTSTRYPLARRWTAVDDLGMQIQRSAERPRGLTHAWSFDVFRRELDNMEHG